MILVGSKCTVGVWPHCPLRERDIKTEEIEKERGGAREGNKVGGREIKLLSKMRQRVPSG